MARAFIRRPISNKRALGRVALRAFGDRGTPIVNIYETNELWSSLKTLRFEKADRQWLDYDAIVGPIANDRTIETLNLYFSGTITQEIALELLLPQKLKDQYVLKTPRAIEAVCFNGVKNV